MNTFNQQYVLKNDMYMCDDNRNLDISDIDNIVPYKYYYFKNAWCLYYSFQFLDNELEYIDFTPNITAYEINLKVRNFCKEYLINASKNASDIQCKIFDTGVGGKIIYCIDNMLGNNFNNLLYPDEYIVSLIQDGIISAGKPKNIDIQNPSSTPKERIVGGYSIHTTHKPELCPLIGHNGQWRVVFCNNEIDVVECSKCGEQEQRRCNYDDDMD